MTANPAKHEKPSTTVDDAAVIDRVIAGDTNAFELLMIKYEAAVLNRVRRHIPDEARQDVLQDVFIRAYRSLDTCRNKDGFGAWLASIAVRTCYDFWRKRYRCKETAVSTLSMAQQDWIDKMSARQGSDDYQRRLARKEAREVLDWALSRLSPEDRMVLGTGPPPGDDHQGGRPIAGLECRQRKGQSPPFPQEAEGTYRRAHG